MTEPTPEDLVALIDWLALPYAGDPVFVTESDSLSPGFDPSYRLRLKATWEAVVGTKGDPAPGQWVTCQTCGHMYVMSEEWPETRETRLRNEAEQERLSRA